MCDVTLVQPVFPKFEGAVKNEALIHRYSAPRFIPPSKSSVVVPFQIVWQCDPLAEGALFLWSKCGSHVVRMWFA